MYTIWGRGETEQGRPNKSPLTPLPDFSFNKVEFSLSPYSDSLTEVLLPHLVLPLVTLV